MLEAIVHRGPDDDGMHVEGPVALGARRLSIIDLPAVISRLPTRTAASWWRSTARSTTSEHSATA
jgi:asparagine synthase (glutamine-hydrolysing)